MEWNKTKTDGQLTYYKVNGTQVSEYDNVNVRFTYCVKAYGKETRYFETKHEVESYIESLDARNRVL